MVTPSDPLAPIVDTATGALAAAGILDGAPPAFDTERFRLAQSRIEPNFDVPRTTISPQMRRFLFHLAYAASPSFTYVAGSYVGFGMAWLAAGAIARQANAQIRGVDVDAKATAIAESNIAPLADAGNMALVVEDALADLATPGPDIDLLFIDIDCPHGRKTAYRDVLEAALPRLPTGSLVLAHDPLVPVFADMFARYDAYIANQSEFGQSLTLPLDECGLTVTVLA